MNKNDWIKILENAKGNDIEFNGSDYTVKDILELLQIKYKNIKVPKNGEILRCFDSDPKHWSVEKDWDAVLKKNLEEKVYTWEDEEWFSDEKDDPHKRIIDKDKEKEKWYYEKYYLINTNSPFFKNLGFYEIGKDLNLDSRWRCKGTKKFEIDLGNKKINVSVDNDIGPYLYRLYNNYLGFLIRTEDKYIDNEFENAMGLKYDFKTSTLEGIFSMTDVPWSKVDERIKVEEKIRENEFKRYNWFDKKLNELGNLDNVKKYINEKFYDKWDKIEKELNEKDKKKVVEKER